MAVDSAVCSRCDGYASLTEHNARYGWACPHCGQSHWPSSDGWAASSGGHVGEQAPSGISPTRAAAAGYSTSRDLLTRPGPAARAARIAVRAGLIGVAAAAALIARTLLA